MISVKELERVPWPLDVSFSHKTRRKRIGDNTHASIFLRQTIRRALQVVLRSLLTCELYWTLVSHAQWSRL